jgi:hypothetical protein
VSYVISADLSLAYSLKKKGYLIRQSYLSIMTWGNHIKTDPGAHPASYPMGCRCLFPGDTADTA